MKKVITNTTKKQYKAPMLSKVGNVAKITLKAGSRNDAFGGSYTP